MFTEALYYHADYFLDIFQRLLFRITPGGSALLQKDRTVRGPSLVIGFDHNFEQVRLHSLRLSLTVCMCNTEISYLIVLMFHKRADDTVANSRRG